MDGEYKDYFVWAGGRPMNIPDASEPGIIYLCVIFTQFILIFKNIFNYF
jgi:hypothetical protein